MISYAIFMCIMSYDTLCATIPGNIRRIFTSITFLSMIEWDKEAYRIFIK